MNETAEIHGKHAVDNVLQYRYVPCSISCRKVFHS